MMPGHFNSRPHKEVDHPQPELFGLRVVISTHDLTRRSTKLEGMLTVVEIFQLTTSQGGRHVLVNPYLAPCSFQLTTSRGGRQWGGTVLGICRQYNSRPHEEVDSGAAPFLEFFGISTHDLTRRSTTSGCSFKSSRIISTHDLTRRSTIVCAFVPANITIFQLTTSRGGRLEQIRLSCL